MLQANLADILELDDFHCVSLVCRLVLGKYDLAGSACTKLSQQSVLIELVRVALASQNKIHTLTLAQLAFEVKKSGRVMSYVKLERVVYDGICSSNSCCSGILNFLRL